MKISFRQGSRMETFITKPASSLTDEQLLSGRDLVIDQIRWARQYTLQLLEATPRELWYHIPTGTTTHVSWQVGHLAVAQYGLLLFRQRGRAEGDMELMPGWLRKQFGRGTTPATDSTGQPSCDDLMARLDAIHSQALQELPNASAAQLREPIEMPYAAYPIKLGAILFSPIHEALHAGQIGLLRRLHGLEPVR
jgi:hypothetical protein